MDSPAQLLIYDRGLSQEEQERQCRIALLIPDPEWRHLLSIEDEGRRWAQWDSLVRGYGHQVDREDEKRAQEERFSRHYGSHRGCPGFCKCEEFNGPGNVVELAPGTCRNTPSRIAKGYAKCYPCFRANMECPVS